MDLTVINRLRTLWYFRDNGPADQFYFEGFKEGILLSGAMNEEILNRLFKRWEEQAKRTKIKPKLVLVPEEEVNTLVF